MKMSPTVIICPGNGCTNIRRSNWYGELYNQLREHDIPCVCENFPDPHRARRDIWIPFIESLAGKGKASSSNDSEKEESKSNGTILIGHSSGAQATLRYAETHPLKAAILVSATYSDLGDSNERLSGYYPQQKNASKKSSEVTNPYDFQSMKSNCKIWHQFHSDNDPFIPLHEAEQIRDGLGLKDGENYHVLPGRSHFFEYDPALLNVILALC